MESTVGAATAGRVPGALRSWWPTFLELFALSGLAIAQPALDVLAKNSELFVTRRATGLETLALVAVALLAVPLGALLLEVVVTWLAPTARRPLHLVLCGLLVAVLAMEVLHRATPLTLTRVLPFMVLAGALGAWLLRFPVVRQILHVLAVAPIVFALLFVFASPVTDAVWSDPAPVRAARVTTPHRVVLVVLDEFPVMSLLDGKGAIDRELYPRLAELADGATWYRNTTTVSGFTQEAVPAILTGRYPSGRSTLPTSAEYPRNLFTLFSGPDLNVHEALTHLCPPDSCPSPSSGLASLVGDAGSLWADFAIPGREAAFDNDVDQARVALRTADRFTRSLGTHRGAGIDFVHVEIPHLPWHWIQSLASYDVPFEPPGESFVFNPIGAGVRSSEQRHLLQVQATDTLVGRMVDRLRAAGAYDDAMVIVTADHGISFTPGTSKRSPAANNLTGVAWTPLLVKYPGQATGRVDDRRAESVDIMPTVAEVLGARGDLGFDGRSLLGRPRPIENRRLYVGRQGSITGGLRPIPGRAYVHLDGATLFPQVLAAQAATPGGDPALRIYRRSPFGGLVGREVGSLETVPAGPQRLRVPGRTTLERASRAGRDLPWLWNAAVLEHTAEARWVAIALDGRIVAAVPTLAPVAGDAELTFLVPPALVEGTRHDVRAFLIDGSPSNLRLQPLPVRS